MYLQQISKTIYRQQKSIKKTKIFMENIDLKKSLKNENF